LQFARLGGPGVCREITMATLGQPLDHGSGVDDNYRQ
jgi:hypothetical protein